MDHKNDKEKMSRRSFLGKTVKVIGGVAVFSWMGGIVYYASSIVSKNVSGKERNRRQGGDVLVPIGEQNEFDQINEPIRLDYAAEIKDGWTTQERKGFVYVTKDDQNELLILSPTCTHLGCTVPFANDEDVKGTPDLVFKCPCHNGQFNKQGINIGGPPPRPLDLFTPVIQDGIVYISILSPERRA